MSIHYRRQGSAIIIMGNTYAFRDQLKAIGARFNGGDRNWRVPLTPAALNSVAALCGSVGGGSLGEEPVGNDLGVGSQSLVLTPGQGEARAGAEWDVRTLAHAPSQEVETSLTIRQLMERLESAVSQAFPAAIWVTGEVQNLARKGSGTFFDLAEARANGHANATVTVRAIIWAGAMAAMQARRGDEKLIDVLQDGLQVRCLCQVQLYKDRGSISLLITDIDPSFTKGALALARERLLKELRAKGLDQANRRLELPPFPLSIGLISADGSRAKADFLHQLATLGYPGTVFFVATTMQGEQVPHQVVNALTSLSEAGCDLIVLTRGGGSAADLRWFDAPEIAFAIARSAVPVIAAIGHHDDVCVAEEICYKRQKTPTAAADFVVSICFETRTRIDGMAAVLAKALEQRLNAFALLTAAFAERLHAAATGGLAGRVQVLAQWSHSLQRSAQNHLHAELRRLSEQQGQLNMRVERRLGAETMQLAALETQLLRRDPSAWLEQGWTRLSGATGLVKDISAVEVGDKLRARLFDGWLSLIVMAKDSRIIPQTSHAEENLR